MNIKINKELKEDFYLTCKQNKVNASALVRKWIEHFVQSEEIEMQIDSLSQQTRIELARNRK